MSEFSRSAAASFVSSVGSSLPARFRLRPWTAGLALLALLGGCSSDGTDPVPDVTPPEVSDVTIAPGILEVYAGPGTVTVEVEAGTPDGITSVEAVVRSPSENERTSCSSSAPATGSTTTGTWSCELPFPQGAETGMWVLDTLAVTSSGAEGGVRVYTGAQVAAEGYPTRVEIRGEVPEPAALAVTPGSTELSDAGSTVSLQATGTDQYGDPVPDPAVTWSSLDPTVAEVDTAGVVTPTGPGSAEIVAALGMLADTAVVIVSPSAAEVVVEPTSLQVAAGETGQLTATVRDQFGVEMPGETVVWSSGNPSVATVDDTGLVSGLVPGTADVTATSGTATGTATVTVGSGTADLSVGLQEGTGDPRPFVERLYTLSVGSAGPAAVADIQGRLVLDGGGQSPPGFSVTSLPTGCSATDPNNPPVTVTCPVSVLAGGADTAFAVGVTTVSFGVVDLVASVVDSQGDDVAGDPDLSDNTTTLSTLFQYRADVATSYTAAPATGQAGQSLTYSVLAENLGPDAATGVATAMEFTSGGVTVDATQVPSECSTSTGSGTLTVTCGSFNLPLGSSRTWTVEVTPQGATTLHVDAATYNPDAGQPETAVVDPNSANDSASATTEVTSPPTGADLSVVVSGPGGEVNPDSAFLVDLTAANAGPEASGTIELVMEAGYTAGGVSDSIAAGPLPAGCLEEAAPVDPGVRVVCTLSGLAAGASAGVSIPVTSYGSGGVVEVTGSVSGSGPVDGNPSNDTDTATFTVGDREADLSVAMAATPDPAGVGETLVHALSLTNAGPELQELASLLITYQGDVTVGSTDFAACNGLETLPNGWSCGLVDVAAGTTLDFGFSLVPESEGTVVGTVSISGIGAAVDPDQDDWTAADTTTVTAAGVGWDLAVSSFEVTPDPVTATAPLTHTVVLENLGTETIPEAVANIRTLGDVSPGSGGTCTGVTVSGGRGYNCFVQNLGPGAQATFEVTLVPQTAGQTLNASVNAGIMTGGTDEVPGNDDAATTAQVVAFSPPVAVSILSPEDGSSFEDSDFIDFEAEVVDSQGVDVTAAVDLQWTSSIDGDFGSAAFFSANYLSGGSHDITLTALDGGEALASDQVGITVTAIADLRLSVGAYGSSIGLASSYELGDTVPMFASLNNLNGPSDVSDATLLVTVTGDVVSDATIPVYCTETVLTSPAGLEWNCDLPTLGEFTGSEILDLAFIPLSTQQITVVGEIFSPTAQDTDPSSNLDLETTTIWTGEPPLPAEPRLRLAASGSEPGLGGPYGTAEVIPVYIVIDNAQYGGAILDATATILVDGPAVPEATPAGCSVNTLTPDRFIWTCPGLEIQPGGLRIDLPLRTNGEGLVRVAASVTTPRQDRTPSDNSETEVAEVN